MDGKTRYFEELIWPHMRSAFNLARWLAGNDQDAEDIVQESFAKAYQSLERFRGTDGRVWLLAIVRNTTFNFLRQRKRNATSLEETTVELTDLKPDPERSLIDRSRRLELRAAIDRLAPEFRETLILRELEGLAYKEIAALQDIPIGTVMSRLARARDMLTLQLLGDEEGRV